MATYKTPGVYIEDVPQIVSAIANVETGIPAFIGYTNITNRQGGVIKPVRITSLLEYTALFGTANLVNITVTVTDYILDGLITKRVTAPAISKPLNTMYYHMQMYFANGGGPCYIVSVGQEGGSASDTDFYAGLAAVALEDEPTLLVFPEGVSLLSDTQLYDLYDAALAQCASLKDRFVIMDCFHYPDEDDNAGNDIPMFRNGVGNNNLKYGAAYYPDLNTSLNYNYTNDTITITHEYRDPDIQWDPNNPDNDLIERDDYLLSAIPDYILPNILIDKNNIKQIGRQAANNFHVELNPSATIAGVYVATDNSRGVWKAPANVSLKSVNGLSKLISEEEQSGLNVDSTSGKSINALRAFPGKGITVWGARTLAGNDGEWRYVSVRRLFNVLEESIKKSIESFVFEANDAGTWLKIKSLVTNYLTGLWRSGAMQGTSTDEAFYVATGLGETMNAQDILEGRLIVEIGVAAVRPAEFIVIRFTHAMAEN